MTCLSSSHHYTFRCIPSILLISMHCTVVNTASLILQTLTFRIKTHVQPLHPILRNFSHSFYVNHSMYMRSAAGHQHTSKLQHKCQQHVNQVQSKVTKHPGLTGTVPVWEAMSRCPETSRSGCANVPVLITNPSRDSDSNFQRYYLCINTLK